MGDTVIATQGLRKTYGRTEALTGLDLAVRPGEVFGYLGPNGAGKTTTIRLLLDLIRPSAGSASVLGLQPRRDAVAIRARVGYLPGDLRMDGRQSADELLSYLGAVRGGVPRARVVSLAERLGLDLGVKIHALSKGNRQKVGLIQAFMHEPELLILDEPTSGLDPFLQQQFAAMARQAADEGRTVFMSSHIMSEVQGVADRVGIIKDGALIAVQDVASLLETASRRVEIVFVENPDADRFAALPGVSGVSVVGPVLRCRLDGRADALVKAAAAYTVVAITSEEPDLEEVFFERFAGDRGAAP